MLKFRTVLKLIFLINFKMKILMKTTTIIKILIINIKINKNNFKIKQKIVIRKNCSESKIYNRCF